MMRLDKKSTDNYTHNNVSKITPKGINLPHWQHTFLIENKCVQAARQKPAT